MCINIYLPNEWNVRNIMMFKKDFVKQIYAIVFKILIYFITPSI